MLLWAQDSSSVGKRFSEDGSNLVKATVHSFTNPIRWQRDDFVNLGYVAAGTALLYLFDDDISRHMHKSSSRFAGKMEDIGYFYGSPIAGTGTTILLFSYGILSGNEWSRETSVLLGSTLAVSGFIQTLSKTAFGRARPSKGIGKNKFKPFTDKSSYHSFPSGHTTVAMSLSLVLAHQVDSYFLKIPLYAMTGVTAWSRLYTQNHWATDIFLGGALSYFAFKANLHFLENRKNKETVQLLILPKANGFQAALAF